MIYINYEQLTSFLEKTLKNCYIIQSDDFFFIDKSVDKIRNIAKKNNFKEHLTFFIEKDTNWNTIFSFYTTFNIFSYKQTITLFFFENELTTFLYKKINQLINTLHPKLLLILCFNKNTKLKKNNILLKTIKNYNCVYINCITPKHKYLSKIIFELSNNINLSLDIDANKLLCYYYEKNLFEIKQTLELLKIIYPNGKLNCSQIKTIINDSSYFEPYNWIESLLKSDIYRANHILKRLKQENINILILIRYLQKELILLLNIKYQQKYTSSKKTINKEKILINDNLILNNASKRISFKQLQIIFKLLTKIELNIKSNITNYIWDELQSLSILICEKHYDENENLYSFFII